MLQHAVTDTRMRLASQAVSGWAPRRMQSLSMRAAVCTQSYWRHAARRIAGAEMVCSVSKQHQYLGSGLERDVPGSGCSLFGGQVQ